MKSDIDLSGASAPADPMLHLLLYVWGGVTAILVLIVIVNLLRYRFVPDRERRSRLWFRGFEVYRQNANLCRSRSNKPWIHLVSVGHSAICCCVDIYGALDCCRFCKSADSLCAGAIRDTYDSGSQWLTNVDDYPTGEWSGAESLHRHRVYRGRRRDGQADRSHRSGGNV